MTEDDVARHAAVEGVLLALLATLSNQLPSEQIAPFLAGLRQIAHDGVDAGVTLADTPEAAERCRRLTHREIDRLFRSFRLPGNPIPR